MTRSQRKKVANLLKAARSIIAVYKINAPLNPPDDAPMRNYTPGVWPDMGDLRRLMEAEEAVRQEFGMKVPR